MRKRLFAILTCVLLVFSLLSIGIFSASAVFPDSQWDVGNYNDYGGGGGGYSGGGYSGGGSSSSSGDIAWFLMFLVRNPIAIIIILVIFLVCYLLATKIKKSAPTTGGTTQAYNPPVMPMDFTDRISEAIRQIDPNFSSDAFITWSKDVFITLQQAWTARDWSTIRPLEKEELFEQHKRQLDEYIANKKINIIERINVGQTHLHKYERDAQYEYLTVYMATRMVDYIIDEQTRKVLKGDPNTDCYMNYLLTFMRKTGVKSHEGTDRTVSKSCPNCGAPLSITSSGKCEYCGSIITTGDFDWVLAKMDAVKANTVIDNRGVILNDGTNEDNNNNNSDNSGNGDGDVSFDDMMNGDKN
ncbi:MULTISPECIES: Tim44 domain-containing protein [unclassified Ruminococcus]|uniref:Tim44 domain-containing protein n=1 Tax=unclassified Ruminococcus TaxID=2608920 RepID=UPI00210AAA7E|nr:MULTISPECIES: Tim44 domain-containing protein [unclassified Ruminococcus]MCQ4023086.1 hypothetical protein [Ruminococcus sp. zg-924]MCQ4115523.1 hypothetical protein [Ruminococcus sp. zg-921]